MNTIFIILTIASILSQIPHAFWAINKFSQIENRAIKLSQNIIFCAIISIGICAFAIDGREGFALGGAIIEVIINWYYYQNQFNNRKNYPLKKTWLAYFLAILIPMSIFIFSREIQI